MGLAARPLVAEAPPPRPAAECDRAEASMTAATAVILRTEAPT